MQESPLRLDLLGIPSASYKDTNGFNKKAIRLNNPSLLMLYLAYRNDWVSRSELAFLFRPDETELIALKHLRLQLHRAKKLVWVDDFVGLEPHNFVAEKDRIRFSINTDIDDFKTAVAAEDWQTAIELYSAPLFEGYSPADLPTYGAWLELERSELESQYLLALQTHATNLEAQGDYQTSSELYAKQLAIDALAEEAVQAYMRTLYQLGSRDKALKAYDNFSKLLIEEFEVEPLEATQVLAKTIRNGESITGSIEELGEDAKLTLKTIIKLPKQATRFVGRVQELKHLSETLSDESCRLLTLIGLGGSGKTRLSIALAQQQHHRFKDGIYFIALSKVNNSAAIITLLAQELNIKLSPRQDAKVQVLKYIEDKEMLLVMDNFEHLLNSSEANLAMDAAVTAPELIAQLLEQSHNLKVLVSSRERLGLTGEWLVDVEGLAYPKDVEAIAEGDELGNYEAIQLFMNSALRVAPRLSFTEQDFLDIVSICAQVEGLPLAIELAASWARIMPISRIKTELDKSYELLESDLLDLPEKHRNIKQIFDTTWQSLSDVKKTTLTKLSVFSGDFSLDAAEFVSGTHFSLLLSLVNESLLKRVPPARFELHQLLKQYSSEVLLKSDTVVEDVKDKHAHFYSQVLKDSGLEDGPKHREGLAQLRVDSANIESAWSHYSRLKDYTALNAIRPAMFYYFHGQALFSEGLELFSKTYTKLTAELPSTKNLDYIQLKCSLQVIRGRFYSHLVQPSESFPCYEEALALALDHDLQSIVAQCHDYMGEAKLHIGEVEIARNYLEKAYDYHKNTENWQAISYNQNALGNLLKRQGKYAEAQQYFDTALKAALKLDDLMWQANITNNLANLTEVEGKYLEAESYYQHCLTVFDKLGYVLGIAGTKTNLGFVALRLGKTAEAKRLTTESLEMKRQIGNKASMGISLINLGEIALYSKDYGEAQNYLLEVLQIGHDNSLVPLVLEVLPVLADVYAAQGEHMLVEQLVEVMLSHPNSSPPIKARAAQLLPHIETNMLSNPEEALKAVIEQIFLKEHSLENAI